MRLHRLELAKQLILDGHEVFLICALEKSTDKELFTKLGIELIELDLPRGYNSAIKNISSLINLHKQLIKLDVDIIEAATIKPVILTGILSIGSKRKIIFWLPGLGYIFTSSAMSSRLLKFIVKRLYKYIFANTISRVLFENSEDMREFVESRIVTEEQGRVLSGSSVKIANINVTEENKNDFQVALIARMLKNKGVLEFVEAAKILHQRGLKVRFVLVGMTDDNPSSISLKRLNQWHSEGVINYLGFVSDMSKIYNDSNLICLPSHREGLPKTIVEAGAYKRASVVTNVVGCREIILDGFNGLLAEPLNPADLADKIAFLIKDDAERFRMANNAYDLVCRKYSFKALYTQMVEVYKDLHE